jgi:putative transposase
MKRKVPLAPGEYYHVYNRGVDKRIIFEEPVDCKRFIGLLFFCNGSMRVDMRQLGRRMSKGNTFADFMEERGETLVDIRAYCLMPNHFHLLLHEKTEGGITLFLKKLCTAYSMYFNTKNVRTGALFERAFLSEHASHDQYLKYLFSYIHLNPAKLLDTNWKENIAMNLDKTRFFIEGYKFSSYRNYLGESEDKEILNKSAFPDYFLDKGIRAEVEEWLTYNKDTVKR